MIKNNFYLIFFGIFSFVATIMGTVAYFSYKKAHKLLHEGVKTTAIVEGGFADNKGHIRYKLVYFDNQQNSHTYWLEKQSWTNPLNYGDKVPVYYSPHKPDEATGGGMDAWFVTILLSLFFFVFGLIGYIGLTRQLFSLSQKKHLQKWGISISAHVDDVYKNYSIRVNNESPYIIRSTYKSPSDNKIYIFYSNPIWFNPLPYLKDSIVVKVDPDNYTQYIVETDFLAL
ncbi:DUF3592 domain-containing protein [Emticicia sp. BO119]|uniref:DUF3592 domain-containing protein n=1 Tax=Emticicia sp. BO119 TaxID=2757768 RepID=UPI0015F0E9F1|nr:DUF3592 domain-containing protein [Emticicia sp. BO119]MBA4853912.1 DUF3592 domain-containing protein [Emticicia sp. BO119]